MIKILLKKQMSEMFRMYLYDAKKNKARSRVSIIGMFVLYAFLIVGVLGGIFTFLAINLCRPLADAGVPWLYFLLITMIAVALGVFGSVFNTFASLYLAKDNDLLLSMPIPVRAIMVSRLLGVYLMGLLYSGIVMLPAVIVYLVNAACRGRVDPAYRLRDPVCAGAVVPARLGRREDLRQAAP